MNQLDDQHPGQRTWVGRPLPLGSIHDGSGTNFSIFSSAADGVELCLFDDELYDLDPLSACFDLVRQDPVVSQVKLIAEPWDIGDGGYQVGNFPPQWSEWDGQYRDTIRNFWRGEPSTGRVAVDTAAERGRIGHGELDAVEAWRAAWTDATQRMLFDADRTEIGGSGLVPDDGDDLQLWLEIHMATQTLDEVRDDPVNRPSRVGRPMSALVGLLGPT